MSMAAGSAFPAAISSARAARIVATTSRPPETFSSAASAEAFSPVFASAVRNSSGSTRNFVEGGDAEQRHGMSRIENAQHCRGIAQIGCAEQVGALHANGNTTPGQLADYGLAVKMAAIEDGDLLQFERRVVTPHSHDLIGDEGSFLLEAVMDNRTYGRRDQQLRLGAQALTAQRFAPKILVNADDLRIALNRVIGAAQDLVGVERRFADMVTRLTRA